MYNNMPHTESRRRQYCNKIDRFTVLLAAIGGVGSALLLARMATYGVNLTDDADLYLSAAQSLLDGDGFTVWTGQHYGAESAPLYPLILAIFSFPSLDVTQSVEYVNAITFGLTIFVISMWLRSRIRSRFLVVWAACACALSVSLAEFSARAGTEIMFTLFVCCSLFSMDRFLSTGRKSLLYWTAICAACALLSRYIGVTLIGTGMLILSSQRNLLWRAKLRNLAAYFSIIVGLFGPWILRNILVVGSILKRGPSDRFSLLDSLHTATSEISMWVYGVIGLGFLSDFVYQITGFSINRAATIQAIILKIAILSYIIIGIGFALSKYSPKTYRRNRETIVVCLGFISIYSIFLMVFLPISGIVLPSRYMIPLFPPLLVITTVSLVGFVFKPQCIEFKRSLLSQIRIKWVSIFASSVVCLWILSWIAPNYDSIRSWNDNGRGYRSKEWLESEIVQYLNVNPREGVIWSNQHAALYYLISNSDDKEIYRLPLDLAEASSAMSDNYSHGIENYIVWFYERVYHILPYYTPEELGASLGMQVEAILKDGFILESDMTSSNVDSPTWDSDFYIKALLTTSTLIINSHFEVYIDDQRNRLIYVRHSSCTLSDIEPRVYLQVIPKQSVEPSEHRQQYIFDDLSFNFYEEIIPISGYCIGTRILPEYDISAVKTGQRTNGGDNIWEGGFSFS